MTTLLVQGAEVSAKDYEGATALMRASQEGHPEVVRLLKAGGAKNSLQVKMAYGNKRIRPVRLTTPVSQPHWFLPTHTTS